ncbi:MAG: hypothetical protein ABSB86_06240 [Bryobacteraceae bacterium]|jgi:hypothetical protein
MIRTVLAILGGYAVIGILVVATDQVFAALIPGFRSAPMPPLYYFGISLATDTFYSIGGGYLCALIARERFRGATLGLMIGGEIVGAASQIAFWQTVPHWFAIALLILYPPAIWIGSRQRSRTAT